MKTSIMCFILYTVLILSILSLMSVKVSGNKISSYAKLDNSFETLERMTKLARNSDILVQVQGKRCRDNSTCNAGDYCINGRCN